MPVEYVGLIIPNVFVVGMGLDAAERFRHLPYIGVSFLLLTSPGAQEVRLSQEGVKTSKSRFNNRAMQREDEKHSLGLLGLGLLHLLVLLRLFSARKHGANHQQHTCGNVNCKRVGYRSGTMAQPTRWSKQGRAARKASSSAQTQRRQAPATCQP